MIKRIGSEGDFEAIYLSNPSTVPILVGAVGLKLTNGKDKKVK